MRMWWTAAAMVAGCWLGVIWPLLVLSAVAVVGIWRHRYLWLVWLVLGYGFGVWQLHEGLVQRLPVEQDRSVLSLQGRVLDIPVTRREFRFGRWQVRQQIRLVVWGSDVWPGTHRVILNSYAPSVLLSAGDRVLLDAELKVPRGVYNRFGPDRARADLAAGVDARGKLKDVSIIANDGGIDVWREALSRRIAASVSGSPFGQAVLPALVVGDRSRLESSLWRTFQLTGGAHLLAISGLHIAIVAGWFWWLGRALLAPLMQAVMPGLRRYSLQQLAWAPGLLGAVGYAALAGFSLPTVRALVMLMVVALAQWWRVPISLWRALGLALLVVLLMTPLAALSASLWLSFGAVACIAMLTRSHAPWRLLLLLPAVMAVASAVLFQQWTPSAPLANLLLVPLYTLLVIPAALLGALFHQPWLLSAAATGVELSVWGMAWLANLGAPSWLSLPSMMAGIVLLLGLMLLLMPFLPFPRRLLPLCLLPWLTQQPEPLAPGEWSLTAFDVGQGLALAIRTREHLLIYDTGPSWPGGSFAAQSMVPWLSVTGQAVDRTIISHGDNDHAGGLSALPSPGLLLSGEPHRVPGSRLCQAGDQWRWDDVTFTVLWPREPGQAGNGASCVLQVDGPFGSALLPGDIGTQEEYRLLGALSSVDLLVVGHHGSKSSTSDALLRQLQPDFALVSAGYRNRFRHPHPQVLQKLDSAGITVLRTDLDGMIVFRQGGVDNGRLITKWRQTVARPWHGPARWRLW
ncbi:DNA internalization-related competence protein ComEC/Rec2 [Alcanivorax sp.]|uniref:DNA internalization-related competence protein ComEC/Rec2 n=1 Tax=Alcanivorax sp. TaxID=1872427 RepID=UPI0032D97BF6